MKISSYIVATALGVAFSASAANAADFIVVYKGTVYASDQFGLGTNTFGNNGASLDGAAFEARFEVNTPTPGPKIIIGGDAENKYFLATGSNAPIFETGFLKINGVTAQFPTSALSNYNFTADFSRYRGPYGDTIRNGSVFVKGSAGPQYRRQDERLALGVFSPSGGFWTSSAMSNSFNYVLQPGDIFTNVGGSISAFSIDRTLLNGQRELVNGYLAVSSVSMNFTEVTPSVPEPATWAMMIIGFGAVGAAMRRDGARRVKGSML